MTVQIQGTDKSQELTLIDPKTGCDYVMDFIGNNEGFAEFDEIDGVYEAARDVLDWWKEAIEKQQEIDIILADLDEETRRTCEEEIVECTGDLIDVLDAQLKIVRQTLGITTPFRFAEVMYMHPQTGAVGDYDDWTYRDQNPSSATYGQDLNAVDRGEVIRVVKDVYGNWIET